MAITLKPTDNVKLKNGSNVFVINKKDGTAAWRKCKPVTCIFDETKISEIQFSGEGDTFAYHSGDTVYIPCGDEYSVGANPKAGYTVTTEDKIINLSNISSLILSDFSPVTYTFEATQRTYYTITVPAKTSYITSASLRYSYNSIWKTTALKTTSQTIQIDAGTSINYMSITPVSGYTAYYDSNDKFTPTGNGYTVPVLRVMPKKPTVTLEIPTVYTVIVTIYNNNPTAAYYHLSMLNYNYSGPIAANTSVTKTYRYSSAHSSVTATVYLYVNDGVSGADTTNFLGNSSTASATATYNPSTT